MSPATRWTARNVTTDASTPDAPPLVGRATVAPRIEARTSVTAPFDGWGFLWRPALIGFLALVAIAVGSSFPDSPFKLEMPGTWFFGVPTHAVKPFAPVNSTTILFGLVLVYGGLVLLMRVWIRLADVALRHPGAPVARLSGILALWTIPMMVIAPVFSRDVFSYAAQGEMTFHGINPTEYGPNTLGSGPYPGPVDSIWANVPAPYGPLFLMLDSWVVQLSGHNELGTVVGLRLLEVAAVALLAFALPVLARALGYDPGHAFVLAVLNPLVVLTLIGGAHNEGLMMALLVAGLALAARKHPVLGIIVCALATSIKAPAALGILYIGWEWLGPNLPVRMRLRPVAVAGLLGAAVLGALTLVSGLGVRWVANLATPGTVRSWAAPATGLGMAIGGLSRAVGLQVSNDTTIGFTRMIGLAIAAGLMVWLLGNADRIGWLKALGYSLLALVVLGPVVQPWYLTWGLLLLAIGATGRLRAWVIALSVISPFVGLPGGRQLLDGIVHAPMFETGCVLLLLWCLLLAPLGKWTQWGRGERDFAPTQLSTTD
jgi:alpha-1,6-mannosyltransferase